MKQKKIMLSAFVLTSLMGSASFAATFDAKDDSYLVHPSAGVKGLKARDLNDENLKGLTGSSYIRQHKELKLDGTQLTDAGALAFAAYIKSSGLGMSVKKISFRDNAGITAEGIAALRAACTGGMYPITLITSDADEVEVAHAATAKAAEDAIPYLVHPSAGVKGLKARDLNDENLKGLTGSSYIRQHKELKLDGTQLTDAGALAFAAYIKSSGLGMSVKKISFRDNAGVTAEGIAALRAACTDGMYKIELITE